MEKSEKPLHDMPADLKKMVESSKEMKEIWKTITPLGGEKRPCCWPGCPHRRPSAAKYFKAAKKK